MTALHDFSTASATPLVELVVAEDLDDCSAARLRDRLEDALRMRPVRLVVDLSRCTAFDVTGLRVLLEMHCEVIRAGGQLVLRAPSDRVTQIVELTGLRGVFAVEDSPR